MAHTLLSVRCLLFLRHVVHPKSLISIVYVV